MIKKIGYGCLVLWGVLTVVFFLFNLAPGDPARNVAGENTTEEVLLNIRKKFDLDLPISQRYFLYLNDVSPFALLNPTEPTSRLYFDPEKYTGVELIHFSKSRAFIVKYPYLKRSFFSGKNVSSILAEVLPGTLILALSSIAMALLMGLPLGIIAALKKDSAGDRLILIGSAMGMSGPSFFVAILVAWLGAVVWRDHILVPIFPAVSVLAAALFIFFLKKKQWIPPSFHTSYALIAVAICSCIAFGLSNATHRFSALGSTVRLPGTGLNMTGSLYDVDVWQGQYLALKNMILPVVTLMIRPLAVIVQLMRSSMLEVMSQDYIRTARAKGLSESKIIRRHAVRNALNPVVTAASGWFASLLAGAVFVEYVFGWKGLGQEMFNAIEKQDMPVVMGGVIVIAVAFVCINLIVDMIYGWIDPRIRTG